MGRNKEKRRGLPAGGKTRPASPMEWGAEKGGPKASRVAENPRGDHQGVGGRVELPRGIDTPGIEELPQGDKTSN